MCRIPRSVDALAPGSGRGVLLRHGDDSSPVAPGGVLPPRFQLDPRANASSASEHVLRTMRGVMDLKTVQKVRFKKYRRASGAEEPLSHRIPPLAPEPVFLAAFAAPVSLQWSLEAK